MLLCRPCAPRPDAERVFEWTYHGRPAAMHPNYTAELDAVASGTRMLRHAVGARVRITAPGDFHRRTGTVIKRGKTRYQVRLAEGVVRVLFASVEPAPEDRGDTDAEVDEAGAQSPPRRAEPVSLSLITTDGRVRANDMHGRSRELLVPAAQLMELVEADCVVRAPSEDDSRCERHVFYFVETDRSLIVPRTVEPTSPEDGAVLAARLCRSERDDSDWLGVDVHIAGLCALAGAAGRKLLLQSVRSGLNLRLEIGTRNGEQSIQIAADRPIDAHEVWRGASRLGDLYVLEAPLSKESLSAVGRLAMVGFGSSGDSPLDVFPTFLRLA